MHAPASGLRVGVLGGMFDPPHNGHVAVARCALECEPRLDQLLVMVAGTPPHRPPAVAPAERRIELARAAFGSMPRAVVSTLEVDRARTGGRGYMVDTLLQLRALHPTASLSLVIGGDQLLAFTRWHRWEEILALAELRVVTRPAQADERAMAEAARTLHDHGARIVTCEMDPVDASSTQVRDALAAGRWDEVDELVPAPVSDLLPHAYDAARASGGGRVR